MNSSSLRYLIKEGFRNMWSNRMMSLASISVLMCCLVLIGCASMVFINIDRLVSTMEDENVVMVYIDDGTSDEDINAMKDQISAIGNISAIEFVPKEEAWADQLKTMEEAQAEMFTEMSTDIPLPDAYKVTVDDLKQFDKTVDSIEKLDNIDIVRDNSDLTQKLVAIRHGVTIIAIVIIVVLFAISLFIIQNTIKLTVYSRRLEITIMKSVGATNSFVRLPFVVEGILLGIIAGIISLGLVWAFYLFAVNQFSDLFNSLGLTAVEFQNYALKMLGIFIVIGIISGVGGSIIPMHKYLNKEGSEISEI